MDIATIIGFVVCTVFVLLGIVTGDLNFSNLASFVNERGILIVVGGTMGALFISFPIRTVLSSWRVAQKAFFHRPQDVAPLVKRMVEFAEVSRREGILALEQAAEGETDPFLTKSVLLAVDGTDPKVIQQILDQEINEIVDRHLVGKRVFDTLAKYAPAWGMIGTLIGLVIMLQGMSADDMGALGEGLGTALLTTFYGAVAANFLFGPIADKLGKRSEEEMTLKRIIMHGIIAIQTGDNPRVVQEKLRVFLPPNQQALQFLSSQEER